MDLTETVTGSETIYSGRVVGLRIDSVTLPDGRSGKREIVEHGSAVVVLPLRDDGSVLLVRQFRLPTGGPLLEAPAGGIEDGESAEDAARRELSEEIGMVPARLTPLYEAYVAPGYCTEKLYGFLAEGLTDERADADEDELVEVVPVPLETAVAMAVAGELHDMKTIACLTLADRLLAKRGSL